MRQANTPACLIFFYEREFFQVVGNAKAVTICLDSDPVPQFLF
jgi:hypothetical protein